MKIYIEIMMDHVQSACGHPPMRYEGDETIVLHALMVSKMNAKILSVRSFAVSDFSMSALWAELRWCSSMWCQL